MKIGKYDIKLITQKLVTSKKIVVNRFLGEVFFEKYEPHKFITGNSGWASIGSAGSSNSYISFSGGALNRTIIGNSNNSSGGYDLGGENSFIIMINKKPNFLRKNMIRFIFGWNWIDKNKL